MGWQSILKIIGNSLPAIGGFVKYIAELDDKEWESVSKVWPGPTKTEMAYIRAEMKAHQHFFGDK